MVWNALSFWDGQPVTSPVYPQMGDLWNPNTSGYQRIHHTPPNHHSHHNHLNHHSHQNHQNHPNPGCYRHQHQHPRMDMGDYRQMSCPMPNYYPQMREPGLDDGEAFCAYNGMEMNQAYSGGVRPGTGSGSGAGAQGDYW
ncbi:uncharacterized protein [Drosophila suzukii]|uniref:Uncharacterized protein n=1 Tax=Drosophila suzukii TaxID=28584 RepID=A0AB39YWF9_DROSZ